MRNLLYITAILAIFHVSRAYNHNVTCYYDTSSINRGGLANFTTKDLELSLQYCTHITYGYVGIEANSFGIKTLDRKQHQIFSQVKDLKRRYRHIKFLLSLGGDKDLKQPEKYIRLLEADARRQELFVKTAVEFMRLYSFDGLDLAYQFPRNKPHKHHSQVGSYVKKAKKLLTGESVVDKSASRHKQQFSNLVYQLKTEFKRSKHMLTLTVLPNVNSTWYFDIPAIIQHLDFVNLGTFDFSTPERNPNEADFLAPIYAPPRNAVRSPQSNIDSQVQMWTSHHASPKMLNIGIATYGRTWKLTKPLKSSQMPIVSALSGPAPGGEKTHTSGLLSYMELCKKVNQMTKNHDKKYGDYAFYGGNVRGEDGILITYESPESASDKVRYIQNHSLGGVAIFDLSLDDFNDQCHTGKFPILKTIKFKLF